MKHSAFVKATATVQNEKREKRALGLRHDFLKLAESVGWGEYETWIIKLHLAFLDFCRDIEDYLEPQEYGTLADGPFKEWFKKHLDPSFNGEVSRRTGRQRSMKPDGTPDVEAIRPLRQKYPRVWWLWDHAERTGHIQMIPRPFIWQRGGAEIPAETKMAILVFPDTTQKDLERTWQSVKRLKDEVYRGASYPRSRVHVPLKKWPSIVRACEDFHGRGKYASVGRTFGRKADTVRTLYEAAHRFVFCGRSEEVPDDTLQDKATRGTPDDLIPDSVRVKRDEGRTIRFKPSLTSYEKMTPEQRALEKQADALLKQASK